MTDNSNRITVEEMIEACSREAALGITSQKAVELIEANDRRAKPLTAVQIARSLFCEHESRIFDEEMERRDMEDEMSGISDPDFEEAMRSGDWP